MSKLTDENGCEIFDVPGCMHVEREKGSLTFAQLKAANKLRDDAHFQEMDVWSATDWACAAAGELGEACNFIKKRRRGDADVVSKIGKELADAVIYIDILAQHLGLDLGEVIRQKFNEISDREGCDVKL